MPHDHSLSLTTTASAMVGGLTRAVSEQVTLSSISVPSIIDVAAYAVVSASVGYGVKVSLDWFSKAVKRRHQK